MKPSLLKNLSKIRHPGEDIILSEPLSLRSKPPKALEFTLCFLPKAQERCLPRLFLQASSIKSQGKVEV